MQILVIGGTGMVGKLVVAELLNADFGVTLLVRSKKKALVSGNEQKLTFIEGDVMNLADVKRVIAQIPNLTHVYFHPPASNQHKSAKNTDVEGTKNILSSIGAGTHFLKLSEIGAMYKTDFFDITQKHISEELIKKSSVLWTLFRPTWFMESIPQLLTMGPVSVSFGKHQNPIWWVSGVDYAKTVVAAVKNTNISNHKTYIVQGIEPTRIPDAIKKFNKLANTNKLSLSLPLWVLSIPALLSQDYYFNKQVMNYYDRRKEIFESQTTHRELHTPTITIQQFAENFAIV
jgi:uncharacterized protein YbjT (DUF2867 family)